MITWNSKTALPALGHAWCPSNKKTQARRARDCACTAVCKWPITEAQDLLQIMELEGSRRRGCSSWVRKLKGQQDVDGPCRMLSATDHGRVRGQKCLACLLDGGCISYAEDGAVGALDSQIRVRHDAPEMRLGAFRELGLRMQVQEIACFWFR